MTEAEWLACDDPTRMLNHLGPETSKRKLRLFVCALCRRHEQQIAVRGLSTTLDLVEQCADGLISPTELAEASRKIFAPWYSVIRTNKIQKQVNSLLYRITRSNEPLFETATVAVQLFSGKQASIRRGRTRFLREIFGNPFRPLVFDPEWRTSTVVPLAQQMYESRDFSTMPILADALQDAGCVNDDILNHCRAENATHVRGCWVVDLVLGKE